MHSSWRQVLAPVQDDIKRILSEIENQEIAPSFENIFKALEMDFDQVRVVIFGQDPYPTRGHATGLAFCVPRGVSLPPSLRNIYKELQEDIHVIPPSHGDLSAWTDKGVLLLNRILTTPVGLAGGHAKIGWNKVTDHIAAELGRRGVIAVLWGKSAEDLSQFFSDYTSSAHPSPLSAYRGFFGSQPFSHVNRILQSRGESQIDWSLK